jgi:hypothetical protein
MPGHSLNVATLLSWLATEALGVFMVRSWIARGGIRAARQRPPPSEGMSLPILASHAGLNFAGLLCWVVFVAAAAKPAAWLAIVLMAPAIGLGISTVTIWTPYPGPGRRAAAPVRATLVAEHEVKRALDDEALTGQLVDEFLARNLEPPAPRDSRRHLRPLVPAGHGVLAIATFALAVLSAVSAG